MSLTRSRNRLHVNKLHDFREWLQTKGWESAAPKGQYEVLRMHRKKAKGKRQTLLVHRTNDTTEHYTTSGISNIALNAWLKTEKIKKMEDLIVRSRTGQDIGYLCPCCEIILRGFPEIIIDCDGVAFYCKNCKQTWSNTKDCLHLAPIGFNDY